MIGDVAARARLSLEGLSIGDAFGERFFVGDENTAGSLVRRRVVPAGPWRWTDDTAMAVAVTAELIQHGSIDSDRLAAAFAQRYLEDRMRGYGRGAHQTLGAIASGVPWAQAARLAFPDGSKGNGAAMRAAPIGAYFAGDVARITANATASAVPTHVHPDAIDGAVAVALAAGYAATRAGQHRSGALLAHVLANLRPGTLADGIERARAMRKATSGQVAASLGVGHRVLAEDTVPFTLWCSDRLLGAFDEALWVTVGGLGDRDTTCAIVGGIVACAQPLDSLPAEWRSRREPLPEL